MSSASKTASWTLFSSVTRVNNLQKGGFDSFAIFSVNGEKVPLAKKNKRVHKPS